MRTKSAAFETEIGRSLGEAHASYHKISSFVKTSFISPCFIDGKSYESLKAYQEF